MKKKSLITYEEMRRFFTYLSSIVSLCFRCSAVNKNNMPDLCVGYILKVGYLGKDIMYYIVVIRKK